MRFDPSRFLMLALAINVVASAQVPSDGGKQDMRSHQAVSYRPINPSIAGVPAGSPEQEQNRAPSTYHWRELYAAPNIPNWVLAVLAGWAGFMALKTLRSIERQTRAAEDAATASLAQVRHLAESERPFLMIEVRDGSGGAYHFYAVNYGKSPAQLVFINPIPNVIAPEIDAVLPVKAPYGAYYYESGVTVFNEQWIPPDKERLIGTLDREIVALWFDRNPEIEVGTKQLLVFGAIKYRGRFAEKIWESKYCYRKLPSGLRMAGPYGWNIYT